MKKEEFIKRYGEKGYEKKQEYNKQWGARNRDKQLKSNRRWVATHPDKAKAHSQVASQECTRKGGKYYEKTLQYHRTGLQGGRKVIRNKHGHLYRPYKQIIAPDSVLHHEWIPETANYTGVALVETDQHQYGYIDVIQILEGEITLLTEDEIRNGGGVGQCRT